MSNESKLFLNHSNGAYAFFKEKEIATWNETAHRDAVSTETPASDLPLTTSGGFLVETERQAIFYVVPSDPAATWSLQIYGWANIFPELARRWAFMSGAEYTGNQGSKIIRVDTQGLEYLYALPTQVTSGTLSVYAGKVTLEE